MSPAARAQDVVHHSASCPLYALAWSSRLHASPRIAVGSFVDKYSNKVDLLQFDGNSLEQIGTFEHSYPATKIRWIPDQEGTHPELLGTTGDFLRIWEVDDDCKTHLRYTLNNNKQTEFCAPLTSFDWNENDPSLIGTSSIDTTCTVWNVETQQAKTQLIAHDREVFDFAFALKSVDVFASVGGDGSVRLFDLRSLDHSTIIYESPQMTPLLRVRWNNLDPNYLAAITMDSSEVTVLDIRCPAFPVATLEHKSHTSPHNNVNALSWAPNTAVDLATGGDGCQCFIWNVSQLPNHIDDPSCSYNANAPVSNLEWSLSFTEWLAIIVEDKIQLLKR